MTPDDPRHGTTRGYNAGCRGERCRAAMARYVKEGRLMRLRGGRATPAVGAQRRIRALMRVGWTSVDIAHDAGWSNRNDVLRIVNGQRGKPTGWLERATDQVIREVYDRLSMRTPPPSPYRERTRNLAMRRGWAGPLCWDDDTIDDPNARPAGLEKTTYRHRDEIDEAAVIRAVGGERLTLTKAERAEVVRRLRAARWPDRQIEMHTGLKADRYEVAA